MSDNGLQTSAPADSPGVSSTASPILVKQSSDDGSRAKEIGIGVGVPMFFILVGLVVFTLWYRRRRRRAAVREMVEDQEKRGGRSHNASDSDEDSVGDLKELEKKRPGTAYGASRQHSRQHSRKGSRKGSRQGDKYRPATSQGLSWAERFNGIPPPKHNEVSLVERLTRSLSQNEQRGLQKTRPHENYRRPQTAAAAMGPRSHIARPTSVARAGTVKQTRFDVPPSPTTSHHNRSISEPLQSITRPKTAPTTTISQAQSQQPPPWSPPLMDLSSRPFTPVSIMPESSFSKPNKGSYALPAAFLSDRDISTWRPQSPGYEVHTELWRQQQQQWILEERRQIKAEYERLMKQRETEQELQRMAMSREGRRVAAAAAAAGRGGSGRRNSHIRGYSNQNHGHKSPPLVRREPSDEEVDHEFGLAGMSRTYRYR